jgi:hypothetical protein
MQRRVGFDIENGSKCAALSDRVQDQTRETPATASAEPDEMLQCPEVFPEDGIFEWSDDGSHFEFFSIL